MPASSRGGHQVGRGGGVGARRGGRGAHDDERGLQGDDGLEVGGGVGADALDVLVDAVAGVGVVGHTGEGAAGKLPELREAAHDGHDALDALDDDLAALVVDGDGELHLDGLGEFLGGLLVGQGERGGAQACEAGDDGCGELAAGYAVEGAHLDGPFWLVGTERNMPIGTGG